MQSVFVGKIAFFFNKVTPIIPIYQHLLRVTQISVAQPSDATFFKTFKIFRLPSIRTGTVNDLFANQKVYNKGLESGISRNCNLSLPLYVVAVSCYPDQVTFCASADDTNVLDSKTNDCLKQLHPIMNENNIFCPYLQIL